MSTPTIQITATTTLTIKLNATKFTVWMKQVESTLIEIELEDFILRDSNQPVKEIDGKEGKLPNPKYIL